MKLRRRAATLSPTADEKRNLPQTTHLDHSQKDILILEKCVYLI
jgi:hypothetical protein